MTEQIIALRGVSVRYAGKPALAGVDLTVSAGERVAVVGPSGAGKSTMLALCTGAVHASRGDVLVFDLRLASATPRQLTQVRRRIGSLHQRLNLVGRLRVVHNVNAGRLGEWPWWRALASLVRPLEVPAALDALARLGIADKLLERTDRLSGGEQQRVALARLLVQDPELVLADEPVASLDPARAEEVVSLLCGAVVGPLSGRALVMSLHDFDLAVRFCDRVVGLRSGHVVFDLPSSEVRAGHRQSLYQLEPSP